MIDIKVSISGIITCCDESLCSLRLGRSYTIEKCDFDSLPFKDRITNASGQLHTDYFGSRLISDDIVSFVCIKKNDIIQIVGPRFTSSRRQISDKDCICEDELSEYMEDEMKYLNETINLLRLFKPGNIGFVDVFFNFKFTVMGFINNTLNLCSHNQTRNTIETNRFTILESEVIDCNRWINDYSNKPYALLKNSIDEFSWGLEQIDIPTGFEQYTTALEMTILPPNQPGKKQMLANRISAMLGKTPAEIQQIHRKVLDFYRFRSESLHDGNGTNITSSELYELEDITRRVLKECLIRCGKEYKLNSSITWDEVKSIIMSDLVNQVTSLKNVGILPS